jgi:hypothetical protein
MALSTALRLRMLLLVSASSCLSLGCGPEGAVLALVAVTAPTSMTGVRQSYPASQPHRAEQPGLSVEIHDIEIGSGLVVRMRLAATTQVSVRRALLAPRVASPCSEGVRERSLELDGERRWARPFPVRGTHELALGFRVDGSWLDQASAIDLVLAPATGEGPDACLRVLLNGPEPELAWKKTHWFSSGGALRGYAPFEPVRGVGVGWAYDARLAVPLGPFRPGLDLGLGFARCRSDCQSDAFGFFNLGFAPALHWFVLDQGGMALDLGLAYQLVYASVGVEAERTLWIHAPTLRLRLAGTVQRGLGIESGARAGSSGLELSLSRWSSPGLDASDHSFVLGAGWAWEAAW